MTKDDIKYIEEKLDIKLPSIYLDIVTDKIARYPYIDTNNFFMNPKKIVSVNLRLRKNGIYGSVPLMKKHFVFGCMFPSSYFTYNYIDLNEDNGDVYFAKKGKTFPYSPGVKTEIYSPSSGGYIEVLLNQTEYTIDKLIEDANHSEERYEKRRQEKLNGTAKNYTAEEIAIITNAVLTNHNLTEEEFDEFVDKYGSRPE